MSDAESSQNSEQESMMQSQFNEVDANYLMIYYSRLTPAFDRSSETIQW